ncbi:MAG TPA: hypothetical protein VIM64_08675 [Puia sp.]
MVIRRSGTSGLQDLRTGEAGHFIVQQDTTWQGLQPGATQKFQQFITVLKGEDFNLRKKALHASAKEVAVIRVVVSQ